MARPSKTPLLRSSEVAVKLGLTSSRVRQLAQAGDLRAAKVGPDGTRYFRAAAVDRLRQARVATLVGKIQQLGSTSQP